jgi:hypothetical protein
MTLPPQYVSYFASDGPKEGGLSVEPGWFQLWPLTEVERWNRKYHVSKFAPGFLGFGSSGGGEMLAFDAAGHVVMLPMVGMSADEAKLVADSWNEFIEKIER